MPDNNSPWGNKGTGGKKPGQNPWGSSGKPPRGKQPANEGSPDLDNIIQGFKNRVGKGGSSGKGSGPNNPLQKYGPFGVALIIGSFFLLVSCFYTVAQQEEAVVLRFGKYSRTTESGLHFKLPTPVETVLKVNVTSERSVGSSQNLVLTGDENIVNIDFSVFWVIKDAGKFLFEIQDPEGTVKAAAETAMREVIAKSDIQPILTEGRAKIEIETQEIIQSILDEYNSGIQITQVQTQKADPPDQVIDAFRDVQAARADMERSKNEAEAYANDVIPRARGEAAKIMQAAEAYKQQVVAQAEGEASRFVSIYEEYAKAKEVTQERMYLETMEKVLADIDKVIIEKNAGSGVVPYLPLPELGKKKASN